MFLDNHRDAPTLPRMLLPETEEQIENIVPRVVREESDADRLSGAPPLRLSLSIFEAGAATGNGPDTLRQQIRVRYFVPSHANSKPVIMVEELVRWLRSLPAESR